MSEPGGRPAIVGTLLYGPEDFALLRGNFSGQRTLRLWQGALILSLLGAVVGIGLSALLDTITGTTDGDVFNGAAPWFALLGAVALIVAGALRIDRQAHKDPPGYSQVVSLEEDGIRLRSADGETLMRWTSFVRVKQTRDYVAVANERQHWVILRPSTFRTPEDYEAATRLVDEKVR